MLVAFMFCASTPFMYCHFGQIATGSYEKLADLLFGCNWQQLPLNLQKFFVLMIENMQRPLHYHGFGVAILNLETFRNVNEYYHVSTDSFQHAFNLTPSYYFSQFLHFSDTRSDCHLLHDVQNHHC